MRAATAKEARGLWCDGLATGKNIYNIYNNVFIMPVFPERQSKRKVTFNIRGACYMSTCFVSFTRLRHKIGFVALLALRRTK